MQGGCLCGAVRFEVSGALSPIELCHCPKCRRAYGAAFAATLYARAGDFRWLRGEAQRATFDAPVESSPPAYRHAFCRTCGAPLPLVREGAAFVELPASSLDGPLEARPRYHQFTGRKAEWLEIRDALERHPGACPRAAKVTAALGSPPQRSSKARG